MATTTQIRSIDQLNTRLGAARPVAAAHTLFIAIPDDAGVFFSVWRLTAGVAEADARKVAALTGGRLIGTRRDSEGSFWID